MPQSLILDEILPLVAIQSSHHCLPDHGHSLMLAQSVLLDSLVKVHLNLLDRLLIVDAGLEGSAHLLLGSNTLHPREMSHNLLLVGRDEDVLDVLRSPLVGWEELVQVIVHSRLLEEAEHGGGSLFSLDRLEDLQHEVQSDPLLDLMLVDDDLEGVRGNHPGAQPESSHLSKTLVMFIGESLEIHQNLFHLFDQHLLEVLVPTHELDEDLLVTGLGAVDVEGILEDAGPGRGRLIPSLILVGAARSEEAPSYENLEKNFTVATIVELVTRCVKELEHSIEVHTDLDFCYIRTLLASFGETLNDRVAETCWIVDLLLIPFSRLGSVTSQTG